MPKSPLSTQLFPEHITIEQGRTGDCYLLATLECIFNSGEEGRKKIESLFTEKTDGVEVRFKKNSVTTYLQQHKLGEKYTYHYDKEQKEDVFTLSLARLKEIDKTPGGVKTNSLAVKILEHLVPYYYVTDWDPDKIQASMVAHNAPIGHKETSTGFLGKVFNIETKVSDMREIIQLKRSDPSYPIYVSFEYQTTDRHGDPHARHAFSVRCVEPSLESPGTYNLVLVNPWDNSKLETFSAEELKKRDCRFCLFNINQEFIDEELIQLKRELLAFAKKSIEYVLETPNLLQLILDLKKISEGCFPPRNIPCIIELYQKMPSIAPIYELLSLDERRQFGVILCRAKGNADTFVTLFLDRIKSMDDTQEKGALLRTCVDFELTAPSIHFKRLKDIIEWTQHYTLEHPEKPPLTVDDFILNRILARAIDENKTTTLSYQKAKNLVLEGILHYYFRGKSEYLTQASGLRTLFEENICTKSAIKRLKLAFPEKRVILVVTITFLENLDISSSWSKETLKKVKALRKEDYQYILSEVAWGTINIRDCFERLYRLSQLNATIASDLYHHSIASFANFSDFAKQISREIDSEFKVWFLNTLPKCNPIREANDSLQRCVESIKAFTISYDGMNTVSEIRQRHAEMVEQLHVLAKAPEVIEAIQTLEFGGLPYQLVVALEEKRNALEVAQPQADAELILKRSRFLDYLDLIHKKTLELGEKRAQYPITYKEAADAAETFYTVLDRARRDFINSTDTIEEKLSRFEKTSSDAIKDALPTLQVHRSWQRVFPGFRLFRTDSAMKVFRLNEIIKSMSLESEALFEPSHAP